MHNYRSLIILGFSSPFVLGAVTPAPLFCDHAVLQRDKPIPVWGSASPNEKVTVSFAGQKVSTATNQNGEWSVKLSPVAANATPQQLVIEGENKITINDVLVGEVWIASGQSNMAWTLDSTFNHSLDINGSANPLIRLIKIKPTTAENPSKHVEIIGDYWLLADPKNTPRFSAVAYHFACRLNSILNVPVGIISSSWGGTRAEPWTPTETFRADSSLSYVYTEWKDRFDDYTKNKTIYDSKLIEWKKKQEEEKSRGKSFNKKAPVEPQKPEDRARPSYLYNGMISPLVPYAIQGVIWYQGEGNSGPGANSQYHHLFSSLIKGWRQEFSQGDFPFYWVQLSSFAPGGKAKDTNWAVLRDSQTKTLSLPATGQAVTVDIGNVSDIHPRNKRDVGDRLARIALSKTYGLPIISSGPIFQKAELEAGKYRIHFSETHGGLISPQVTLTGFELAGADQKFHPADAIIENNTVLLSSTLVPSPVAVRYAWSNVPQAGLFNNEGLPALPFRTDNW